MSNLRDNMMCVNATCPAKKSCARYSINPERGQALYHPDPKINRHGSCEHFIANDELQGAVLTKRDEFLAHTHKYHTIQHREDSTKPSKAVQVEFFHRNTKQARLSDYARSILEPMAPFPALIGPAGKLWETLMLSKANITPPKYSDSHESFADAFNDKALRFVERGHCTRAASDHTVDLHAAETMLHHRSGPIHVVVMAEDHITCERELACDVIELNNSNY